MDRTDSAHSVNIDGIIPLVKQLGGWVPPPHSGAFSLAMWEVFLGVDQKTIRRRIVQFEIPYRKFGATILVESGDMLKAIPYAKRKPKPKLKPPTKG